MSIEPSNPIFNIGDLAKPAVVLIEKVSDAVGGIYKPYQIKRVAKAENEAAMFRAEAETQITDLQRRAAHRWLREEEIHQKNMEEITAQAIILLKDDVDPVAMENDWIANFFAKARIVSDSEIQELWARILAGEANSPGTFSQRTLNILSDLDKVDAEAFAKLCGFVWVIETESETEVVPLVLDVNAAIYGEYGIDFVTLRNLESMGLLVFDGFADLGLFSDSTFPRPKFPEKCIARYHGSQLLLDMPKSGGKGVRIGHTFFTRTGKELASICGGKPVDEFFEYVKEQWKLYLPESDTSEENKIEEGYAILSEMIGFVDSGATDGSINHDDLIYELRSKA